MELDEDSVARRTPDDWFRRYYERRTIMSWLTSTPVTIILLLAFAVTAPLITLRLFTKYECWMRRRRVGPRRRNHLYPS